jgi:hypothetical protein
MTETWPLPAVRPGSPQWLPAGHRPLVRRLRGADVRFRSDIVDGVGGRQVLIEDPSGNPVELFEPTIAEARLSSGSS